ncbi:MAG: DUF4188 domain-containing protein [Acidobacteriaceae bacterium]
MPIFNGRYAAQIQGDFVVFLIGMRINHILRPHKWLPVTSAMPRMLRELALQPQLGMLHGQSFISGRTVSMVQYWRSFEQLHAYAHAKDLEHLPVWAEFNRKVGGNGSVGIFHETYLVKAGQYECVYANMPRFGLAKAGEMLPAAGRLRDARSRLQGSA